MVRFGEWLKQELDERGIKQDAFARRMGVSQGTVSKWIGAADIKAKYLAQIGAVLDVPDEKLIEITSQVDPSAEYEAIPITGNASAGRRSARETSGEYVVLRPRRLRRYPGNQQALFVRGTCLEPEIRDGDVAIIDPDLPWEPGKRVALRVDADTVQVKILVSIGKELVLTSNEGELRISDDDARIVGTVAYIQRSML